MLIDPRLNRDRDWFILTAIAITVWLVLSILVSLANPVFARSIWPALFIVFILAYGYLAICNFINRAKEWSEHYLDTLLDPQMRRKEREDLEIQAMVKLVGKMGKRVDRIEAMLTMDEDGGPEINVPSCTSTNSPLPERTHESPRRGFANDPL
jgi:hypothetical protein